MYRAWPNLVKVCRREVHNVGLPHKIPTSALSLEPPVLSPLLISSHIYVHVHGET